MPEKITLAAARVNAGLSQKDAAKLIGVSPATLRNDVRKIVKLMDLTPEQIIDVFFRENPEGWPYVDPDDPE